MNDTHIKTLDHVRQFLNGLGAMEFQIDAKASPLCLDSDHAHSGFITPQLR